MGKKTQCLLGTMLISVPLLGCQQGAEEPAPAEETVGGETRGQPGYMNGDEEGAAPREETERDSALGEDGQDMTQRHGSGCPMALSGVDVEVQQLQNGAALVFSAPEEQVGALQQTVQQMAQRMQQQSGQMGMQQGNPTAGVSDASVQDVMTEDGARLELTTGSPDQVEQLRENTRQKAEQMQAAGRCPMMEGGMQPGGMQPGGMQPGGMQPGGMQQGGMPGDGSQPDVDVQEEPYQGY